MASRSVWSCRFGWDTNAHGSGGQHRFARTAQMMGPRLTAPDVYVEHTSDIAIDLSRHSPAASCRTAGSAHADTSIHVRACATETARVTARGSPIRTRRAAPAVHRTALGSPTGPSTHIGRGLVPDARDRGGWNVDQARVFADLLPLLPLGRHRRPHRGACFTAAAASAKSGGPDRPRRR